MNYTLQDLTKEFEPVSRDFSERHATQRQKVSFYNNGVYYAPIPGEEKPKRKFGVNLIKIFVDKNVQYTSTLPTIKVPHASPDPESRLLASKQEKILYGTHEENMVQAKFKKWAYDATLMAEAFAVTEPNYSTGRVEITRLDPRFCYYKYSNQNDEKITAFWFATAMTAEEIKAEYGIDPTGSGASSVGFDPGNELLPLDGVDRFWCVFRWDAEYKCAWVGNRWLIKPFKHELGQIPVDIARPFETGEIDRRGGFFMSALEEPQAEFNETLRRKSNVIRKHGNPPIVGRNIVANQFDDMKNVLSGEGGFVGVKKDGGLEFLQLRETAIFDQYLDRIWQMMKDLAQFPTATFGESVGANTSGDALSMYFQPTAQAAASQWISWKMFFEGINSKIFAAYRKLTKDGTQFEVFGNSPRGTFSDLGQDSEGNPVYGRQFGAFQVMFGFDDVAKANRSIVIPPSATPKDELAMKKWASDAVGAGFISRTTAYEQAGFLDPEDEIELLKSEREDPRLHPEVTQAALDMAGAGVGGQLPPGSMPPPPMGA